MMTDAPPSAPTPRYTIATVSWQQADNILSDIRRRVFIEEQSVPEELEWDGLDPDALHLLASGPQQQPIGTVRLLKGGHIGRMAVLPEWRGHGIGSALLDAVLTLADEHGMPDTWLNAQLPAIDFYQRAGFTAIGDRFLDAGIPHRRMQRRPDQEPRSWHKQPA